MSTTIRSTLLACSLGLMACAADGVSPPEPGEREESGSDAPELSSKTQAVTFPGCNENQVSYVALIASLAHEAFLRGSWDYHGDPWSPAAIRAFGQPFPGSIEHVKMAMSRVSALLQATDRLVYECNPTHPACSQVDVIADQPGVVRFCAGFWRAAVFDQVAQLQHEYMHWVLGPADYAEEVDRALGLARNNPLFAIYNPTNYLIYNMHL